VVPCCIAGLCVLVAVCCCLLWLCVVVGCVAGWLCFWLDVCEKLVCVWLAVSVCLAVSRLWLVVLLVGCVVVGCAGWLCWLAAQTHTANHTQTHTQPTTHRHLVLHTHPTRNTASQRYNQPQHTTTTSNNTQPITHTANQYNKQPHTANHTTHSQLQCGIVILLYICYIQCTNNISIIYIYFFVLAISFFLVHSQHPSTTQMKALYKFYEILIFIIMYSQVT